MDRADLLRAAIAALVIVASSILYVVDSGENAVEPQSVFTLYGAILGYVFGAETGRRQATRRESDLQRREADAE